MAISTLSRTLRLCYDIFDGRNANSCPPNMSVPCSQALIMQIDYSKVSPSGSGYIDFMMCLMLGTIIAVGVGISLWLEVEEVYETYVFPAGTIVGTQKP